MISDPDLNRGMVIGNEGSVLWKGSEKQNWKRNEITEGQYGEWVKQVLFDLGLNKVIVIGVDSMFSSIDIGKNWEPVEIPEFKDEWIEQVIWHPDLNKMVLIGDKGSVFSKEEDGRKWKHEENLILKDDE